MPIWLRVEESANNGPLLFDVWAQIPKPPAPPPLPRIAGKHLVDLDQGLRYEPAFVRELVYEHALLDPSNAREATTRWLLGSSNPSIRVRLGSLDQLDDGLLGFFMQSPSNAWRLHVVPYYARQAWQDPYTIIHSIMNKDTSFDLQPNAPREAFLLLDGLSAFHVQTGLLPRKRIDPTGLVHQRILSKLLPTLRVGPVLFSETARRIASGKLPERTWSFVERQVDPNAFKVTPLEAFTPALSEIPYSPLRLGEGWLRVDIES